MTSSFHWIARCRHCGVDMGNCGCETELGEGYLPGEISPVLVYKDDPEAEARISERLCRKCIAAVLDDLRCALAPQPAPCARAMPAPGEGTATYDFELILDGIDLENDDLMSALYEAGCDDGTFGGTNGVPSAMFDRDATSRVQAIISAIRQVESTGVRVVRVDGSGEVGEAFNAMLRLRGVPVSRKADPRERLERFVLAALAGDLRHGNVDETAEERAVSRAKSVIWLLDRDAESGA